MHHGRERMSCMFRTIPRSLSSRRRSRPGVRLFFTRGLCLNYKSRAPHDDLSSFLRYAQETGLDNASTVYVGTLYEYTVQAALARLQMKLSQIGGKGDRGIDLSGTWTPPTPKNVPPRTIAVYVQCKAEQMRGGPRHLRELEGMLAMTAAGGDHIGILACIKPPTPGTIQTMLLSKKPLAYVCVTPHGEGGYLRQCIWNNVAAGILGHGLGITTKYFLPKSQASDEDEKIRAEAVLTLDGKVILADAF
ncbi:hypothetical protein EDC01DRAFT_671240 [Geopyxis carbonaria]|nr:hypothetical protein EDC01DRAFT_671240 [Geopyxis carbonaria]